MKLLILVRHGIYDEDTGELNGSGQQQMRLLSEKLRLLISGNSVLVLSSTADRARESAEILSIIFGTGFEEYPILWSDIDHPENFPELLEFIKSRKDAADAIILVTHLEYAEGFPWYYVKEILGKQINSGSVMKGEACVIDCETGVTKIVSFKS